MYDLAEYLDKPNQAHLYEEIFSTRKGTILVTFAEEDVDGQRFLVPNVKSDKPCLGKINVDFSSRRV